MAKTPAVKRNLKAVSPKAAAATPASAIRASLRALDRNGSGDPCLCTVADLQQNPLVSMRVHASACAAFDQLHPNQYLVSIKGV